MPPRYEYCKSKRRPRPVGARQESEGTTRRVASSSCPSRLPSTSYLSHAPLSRPSRTTQANGVKVADPSTTPVIPSFAAAHQGAPPELPAPAATGPAPAPIPADVGTPDDWVPRDERLIRLTGRHPLNCEPHLSDLLAAGFITPVSLHFVRNHGAAPKREWATHTLTLDGLVPNPLTLTMDALVALRPRRELTVTFCCAGNRRKEQNLLRQTRGFSWGAGAVSTSVWAGMRLADLLATAGVDRGDPANARRHVRFTGPPGELPNGDGTYGTSIPLLKALDPAADVLIAYKQNGRWLAPDHGFPVRVILPGHIGGRTIKWLTRIEVSDVESDNWYHFYDNRVFSPHILTPEDAEAAGVWKDPDFMINHFNINSATCEPAHDAVVPLSAGGGTPVAFKGYAYAGGGRKVTRVEASLDGGLTWRPAAIHRMEPPTEHGMHWTWVFWSVEFTVGELASAPAGDVQVRAADETMNSQPGRDACVWSLLGMQGNAHFAVRAVVEMLVREATAHGTGEALAPGAMVLRFQHPAPIQPGPLGHVGWREEEAAARAATADAAASSAAPAPAAPSSSGRKITVAELGAHATDEEAAWFAYRGRVYDATAFLEDHPGGAESILISTGADATADFDAIHSAKAKAMLKEYFIGDLVEEKEEEAGGKGGGGSGQVPAPHTPPAGPPAALDPRARRSFPLVSKTVLSPNSRLFKFGLPAGHVLGLPVGKHVFLYGTPPGGEIMRAYTPVSKPDGETLDLLIKVCEG
jgi:nitrate reductase (NAD(P)H)